MADNPITREEQYLAYLNRQGTAIPSPITRTEQFLYELCMNGGLGGGTSINILGELASTSELPSADVEKGDAYIINGELWVYSGSTLSSAVNGFSNCGRFTAGNDGQDGEDGEDGKSAYDIWLDAGNTGSEEDFLESLKGKNGDSGTTYTPVIGTVRTVDNLTDAAATVTVDATNKKATFNFSIPKGEAGAKGDKGDTGERGEQGLQGIQGERGETGLQGQQGIQGIKGDKGDDGYPFLIYKQYEVGLEEFNEADYPEIGLMFMVHVWEEDKGYPVYRYTADGTDTPYSLVTHMNTEGIKGEKGDKGDTGEQGIAGLDGKDGKDGTTYTPSIGEVTTVDSTELASATVSIKEDTKEAVFNFAIPKGNKGLDSVQISDNETVENKTWSSQKTSSKIAEVETELNAKVDKKEYYNALDYGNPIIPQDADLNDYLTPGVYTCMSSTIANTLLNCPHIGSNFKLIVNKNRGNDDTLFYGYQMIVGTKGGNPVTDVCVYYRGISVYNNVCVFSKWKIMSGSTVADVPETTVDLTGTDIRGSIKYMVKSGICYVSAWGVLSDTVKSAHILVKADVMPKPIISCGTVLVHGDSGLNGKLVGQLYIDYNKALSLHIYPDSVGDTGFGSFSYPVAES